MKARLQLYQQCEWINNAPVDTCQVNIIVSEKSAPINIDTVLACRHEFIFIDGKKISRCAIKFLSVVSHSCIQYPVLCYTALTLQILKYDHLGSNETCFIPFYFSPKFHFSPFQFIGIILGFFFNILALALESVCSSVGYFFCLIMALERKRSLHLTTHLQLTLRWQHITWRIEVVYTWFVKWCTSGPVHKGPPSCPPHPRIFSTDKNVGLCSLSPARIKQCASLLYIKVRGHCSFWSTFGASASHARKKTWICCLWWF